MRNVKRSLGLFLAFGVLFLWPFSAIAAETEPVHSTDPFVTASLNAAWNDSTALVDGKISQGEYAVSQLLSVGNGLYLHLRKLKSNRFPEPLRQCPLPVW